MTARALDAGNGSTRRRVAGRSAQSLDSRPSVRVLSYPEALAAIQSRGRFGVRLGLSRTRALLAALGHPERQFRGALIAGTNGKGSVLTLVSSALAAAGYRTGVTPKPHLVTYRERLQIAAPEGSRLVDRETFARLTAEVTAVADRVAGRLGEPTEFELLTAITFRWFAETGVDLAVVEVGLGGRLDATHAWDGGVAVVTNVSLDHMAQLGPTVEAIAREKAAIVMRGDRAVTGASGGALRVVERRARSVAAPLTVVATPRVRGSDRAGLEVDLGRLGPTRVGLLGAHQAANAAVADATLDALEAAGIATVPDEARRAGYAAARWPGRLELLEVGGRDVVLDGAHNPAGAAALAAALDDLRQHLRPGALTLLLAISADKDVRGVLAALHASATVRDGARIVCTEFPGGRALPAEELASAWLETTGEEADAVADPGEALDRAFGGTPGPLVVAGSLYLVGCARGRLVDDPRLVADPPIAQEPLP